MAAVPGSLEKKAAGVWWPEWDIWRTKQANQNKPTKKMKKDMNMYIERD